MSTLNKHTAFGLKRGDKLYHNIIAFGGIGEEKEVATCTVLGPAKEHDIYGYLLPVRLSYSGNIRQEITEGTQTLWRTTPEKQARSRIRNKVATVPEEALEEEGTTRRTRVRRHR